MINHLSLLLLVKWKMLNLALQIFKVFVQILLNVNLSLDDSIDSGNFSVKAYVLLTPKDSSTHIQVLAVYMKDRLSFAWDLSLENTRDFYSHFLLALIQSVS